MLRLASMLYGMIGTTVAGIFVVIALVTGNDTLIPIVGAALVGFVVGAPIAFVIAKAIYKNG